MNRAVVCAVSAQAVRPVKFDPLRTADSTAVACPVYVETMGRRVEV
jgi:hypothetical protein